MAKKGVVSNERKASSFQVPNRTSCLTFIGTPWEGAEVVVRLGISIALYLRINQLVEDNDPMQLAMVFGDVMLESWNLVDEKNKPIPATGDGMASLPDLPFSMRIVTLWLEAVAAVSDPLGPPSVDGNTLVRASIALESP